jgi:cbb3-type cytochrome oxidase subunit 1
MIFIIGIVAVILGGTLRYWVNRNRFNRRNPSGLEQFSSYNKSVAVTAYESVIKNIGTLLLLVGLLFFAIHFYSKTNVERFRKQKTEQK